MKLKKKKSLSFLHGFGQPFKVLLRKERENVGIKR